MKNSEILLKIDPDTGTTEIEVVNGDGKTCTSLTEPLESALGTVESRDYKPEYRRNAENRTVNRARSS